MKLEAKQRLISSEELSVAEEAVLIVVKAFKPEYRLKNAIDKSPWAGPAISRDLYTKTLEELNRKNLLHTDELTEQGKSAIEKIQVKYKKRSSTDLLEMFREKLE